MNHVPHKIKRASFGLLNERGDVVIGGQSEIAGFDAVSGRQLWRARHTRRSRNLSHCCGDCRPRRIALLSFWHACVDGSQGCAGRLATDYTDLKSDLNPIFYPCHPWFLSLSALAITDTELKLIAAAAIIGLSRIPKNGYKIPAAIGTPIVL